jgi:hypothetical protein
MVIHLKRKAIWEGAITGKQLPSCGRGGAYDAAHCATMHSRQSLLLQGVFF